MNQSIYRFTRLVQKYSNPLAMEIVSDGEYNEDTGEYVVGETENVTLMGAIMPLKARAIYESGGRLTESDRLLYSLTPFEEKQKVLYKEKVYTVEAYEEYIDFADFHYYLLKAVSAFHVQPEQPTDTDY